MIRPRQAIGRFSLALSLICVAPAAWGEYDPIGFCDLVGTSDVIASGEIVEVRIETFTFDVDEVFAGKVAPRDRLEIGKFDDWACAWRVGAYQAKERLFVFLEVDEVDGRKKFHIRGAGDEGELPIVDGEVYVQPFSIEQLGESVEFGTAAWGGGHFVKVPYRTFRDSVVGFRKCFEVEASHDRRRSSEIPPCFSRIKQLCNNSEVVAFSAASDLNRHLIDEFKGEYQLTVKHYGPQMAPWLEAAEHDDRQTAPSHEAVDNEVTMTPPPRWSFALGTIFAGAAVVCVIVGYLAFSRRKFYRANRKTAGQMR